MYKSYYNQNRSPAKKQESEGYKYYNKSGHKKRNNGIF